jgi:plasmid replication initiation protein
LMNTLLQHAHDSGRLTELDAEWEISFAHLRHCQSRHESNDRIRESLKRIRRIEVKITYTTESGERRELESSLLTFTDTSLDDTANATVQFGIPARLRKILARSNRWGRIRCEIGYAMSSKYAVALYEMICLRSNLDHCFETIDMQRFRDLLGVPPGTYNRADNFMRNVVMPATREVNGLSDTCVRIDLMRKHPRATAHAVTICWWRMSPETFQTAAKERDGSKVGRLTVSKATA